MNAVYEGILRLGRWMDGRSWWARVILLLLGVGFFFFSTKFVSPLTVVNSWQGWLVAIGTAVISTALLSLLLAWILFKGEEASK